MRVVDDLLADIDRLSIHLKRTLDRVDGPLDSGAIAPGRGEDDPLHQTAGQDSQGRVKTALAPSGMRKPAARGGRCGGLSQVAHRGAKARYVRRGEHRPVAGT